MLKYSTVAEDGTFSPTHKKDPMDTLMSTIESKTEKPVAAKMAMKKRSKRTQKRANESSLLPPIAASNTPSARQKDVKTPYINHRKEVITPYIAQLGIDRLADAATPYLIHTRYSKVDAISPIPRKDNVLEIRHEMSFTNDSLHKMPTNNSPLLEKRRQERQKHRRYNGERAEAENQPRLQIRSNQIGLYDRGERMKLRETQKVKIDEPFSIRKKIEQFRKWHEEQYKEKLKKLKQEVDNQFEYEHKKLTKSIVGLSDATPEQGDSKPESHVNDKADNDSDEDSGDEKRDSESGVELTTKERNRSARTWKTWRDVNDSYAYNDVKRYIEENELMTPEKESWIRNWIIEVENALDVDTDDNVV